MNTIHTWFETKSPKPLMIKGPKGVGKTRLVTDFLATTTENKIYMNFELTPSLIELLDPNNLEHSIQSIKTYFSVDPSKDSIIILDECCLCEFMISELMSNNNQSSNLRFIFISSYPLNVSISSDTMEILTLYPLDFEEFLEASNNPWYISVIKEHYKTLKPIPDIVHSDILNIFYDYLVIGGMPSAINEYLTLESILNVSEIHYLIQNHQLNCLRLHNSESSYTKLESLYQTLDLQLSKKNRKFKYNIIRKGATKNQYISETQTLEDYGLILNCQPIEESIVGQKLYLYDVGVLVSKMKMNVNCKELSPNTEQYKGFLENYVAQTLTAGGHPLYFWESGSQAKIDFILKKDNEYIPIEIYSDDHTKSKSVNIFSNTYDIEYSIKISPRNFGKHHNIQYVPLYAVFCI